MLRTRTIHLYTSLSMMLAPVIAFAYGGGPDDNYAGNPPTRQTCVACHSSFALNSGRGSLQLQNLPESYQPGETYRLTIALADPNARRWGFELTSIDDNNRKAGVISVVNQQNTQVSGGGNRLQYLKHTSRGTAAGQANGNSWEFDWTAPADDIGAVHFYFAGNAANNSGGDDGDRIYAASMAIDAEEPPPPPPPPDSLVVSLATGWNLVSTSVIPHALDLDSVFVGLLRSGRLQVVRNLAGQIYNPAQRVDQIVNWDTTASYQIKMSAADRLVFFGDSAKADAPITLNNGWNWIAYTRMDTLNPSIFNDIGGVAMVKDGNGHFAALEAQISNLGWITPGSGWMINMQLDQPIEFTWPAPEAGPDVPHEPQVPQHFTTSPNTGSYMNVVLTEWDVDAPLGPRDEIAVRSGSDLIVGSAVVHEGVTFLTIWGDDNTTEQIDGAVTDSALVFTYWFAALDSETVLIPSRQDQLPITYTADTWANIALASPEPPQSVEKPVVSPTQFTLNGVFPNPFNPTAEVSFSLPTASLTRITLWDNAGKMVKSFSAMELEAGDHRFTIEGAGLPAGVYLVSVEAGGQRQMTRALLLK